MQTAGGLLLTPGFQRSTIIYYILVVVAVVDYRLQNSGKKTNELNNVRGTEDESGKTKKRRGLKN